LIAQEQPTVFVVDDDQASRDSLRWLIESVGLRVETFASARELLDNYNPDRSGCMVLDVRMPGMSGLDLFDRLAARRIAPPTIIITGHGDVPMAVRALKAGVIDFIEKPFNDQVLLDCIQRALERDTEHRHQQTRREATSAKLALLTPREREVMDMLVAGLHNRDIAARLGISIKTVEAHRAKVMDKMQADSMSDLVRMALESDRQASSSV